MKIKLSEIAEFKNGINFNKTDNGHYIKCIGVGDFGGVMIVDNFENTKLICVDKAINDSYYLKDNDILFVRSNGNKELVGRSMLLNLKQEKVVCSGFCICMSIVSKHVLPIYLYLLLNTITYKKQFAKTQQTSINNLNQSILGDILVEIPSLQEQRNRIDSLLPIINKIKLNNKINETLHEQAQDIYTHLFFRKTPNGRIADIIIENEKSTIQVGEAKATTGTYPFFTSGEAILEWKNPLVNGRNCFLNTGGNADVKFYVGDCAYSTDTWCVSAKDELSDYLYLLLNTIKIELNQKFFQGTGLKHLQKELLKDRQIYIPSEKEIKSFNKIICPMFNMISEFTRENQELTRLRDWILPMLMNGQATVAEEQAPTLNIIENDTKNKQSDRFAMWLQNQGLAARGDIDKATLREIFDAMDDDDK